MAKCKLGVDNSSTGSYKLYDSDGTTEIGTISGLAEGLVKGTDPAELPESILVEVTETNKYTITLSNGALPASPEANASITATKAAGTDNTFTFALSSSDTNITKYGATKGTPTLRFHHDNQLASSGIFIEQSMSEGWNGDGTTTITYKAADSKELAKVTGMTATTLDLEGNDADVKLVGENSMQIELGANALGTGTLTLADTASQGYSLKLAQGVIASKDDAADGYDVNISSNTLEAKAKTKAYWTLSGNTITYHAPDTEGAATITVNNLANGATKDGETPNVIFDAEHKTITLKKSALQENASKIVTLIDTGNKGFKLALYAGTATDTENVPIAEKQENVDFEWKIEPVDASGNTVTEGAVAAKATIQKVLDAGWTLATEGEDKDKKITYSAEKTLTYATISDLNPETDEDDLPSLANITEDDATNTETAYALTLTKANFPTTTTTAVITLANATAGDNTVAGNFSIQIAAGTINSTASTLDEYEVENTSGTATVKQMIDEYCEAGTGDAAGKKLTYHAKKAAETALATVTGLKTDATIALKGTTEAATAAIVVDPGSKKEITLKATAFPTEGLDSSTSKKVTLTSTESYKLALSGVTAPDQNSGAPTVVAGESGTFKVQQAKTAGWTLETATTATENEVTTTTQEVTHSAPEAETLAIITVTNGATGIAESNFTVSGNTVTVAQEALNTTDNNTTVAIENETGYAYALALGDGITKFGATNNAISLAVDDDSTDAGDKLAEVRQAVSDGWYIPTAEQDSANAGKIVYKANGYNVLATVTGLASGAVYEANGSANTIALSGTDNKTITLKKAALPGATEAAATENPYTVTKLANATGQSYKLAFGEDVSTTDQAPNTTYSSASLGDVDETGTASITGALNEGWTLATAGDKITYTAATANTTVLATISGLKASAASGIAFGTTADDESIANVNEFDKNVVYLTTNALDDKGVTLVNKTGGDFKLSLKDDDDKVTTKLGYAENYAWTLNNTGTTATFKQGNEKGWTLASNGLSVTFDARVDPTASSTTAATLLTVSGLNGDDLFVNYTSETEQSSFLTPGFTSVGTKDDEDNHVVGLQITTAYAAATAEKDDPATTDVDESKPTIGTITLKKNVLGTGTMQLTGTDKEKYNFELFDDASTSGGATADTFVPSKAVDKYYWFVNGNRALYKQATAEYWALDSTGKKVTHYAQTDTATLATITGITSGLQAKQGDDFTAARTAADANKTSYVITGSFVYANNEDSKAIEMTTDYRAAADKDDPETTDVDESKAQLGVITLYDDAVSATDATDVKFTSGSDKYRLTLDDDFKSTLAADTQAWEVSGTTTKTANYYNVYENAGYKVYEKDTADATDGKVIKFFADGSKELLATITGLNKDVVISEDDASIGTGADDDFEAGIEVTPDGATVTTGTGNDTVETTYDAFVLSSNVLGTDDVALTNGTDQDYRLALDTTTDAKVLTEATTANVWRLEGTTATYKNVTQTYYKAATDAMSIDTTAEKEEKVYATITNLASGLVEKDGMIFAADETTQSAETQLLAVGKEPIDGEAETKRDIITVNGPALNTAKELKLSNGTGSTYALVLGEDADGEDLVAAGIDTTNSAWSINGTTAIYKASWTAGWLPNATETSLKYYNEGTGKEIFRITGLKSGLTADAFSTVTVEAAPGTTDGDDYIELPDEVLGTTDVKIGNANRQNGVAFDYGIKLGETDSEAAGTAIEGVKRWSLSGTTLSLNNIHDGHHEDEAVKKINETATTGISKTTIKYVSEAVDSTAIVTITNLASGLELATPDENSEDKIVNGRYEGDTPVDGISVNDKTIKLSKKVLTTTAANPTTLTNKTGALSSQIYKLDVDTETVKDQDDAESFTVSGTSAILYKVKTAGYEWNNTKVTYLPEVQGDKIATISGIASGLTVGSSDATNKPNAKDAVGYIGDTDEDEDGENDFVPAITYDTNYKFTIADAKALAPNPITVDNGTLEFGNGVIDENTNLAAGYAWVVKSGTYTYNKGTTAGWKLDESDSKTIKYSAADYPTAVATVSGLKGGLKPGTVKVGEDETYGLVSNNKIAVSVDDGTITINNLAVNAKDILLARAKDNDGKYVDNTEYTLALEEDDTTTAVAGKKDTPVWAQDSKTKSTYTYTVTTTAGYDSIESPTEDDLTVNKVVYDDRIVYTKAGKSTATLTGLKTDLAISKNTTDNDTLANVTVAPDGSTITVDKAALDEKTVTLKNSGSAYNLELGDGAVLADAKVWTIGKGTATYIQQYKADSYVKKSDLEYNYTGKTDGKDVTLATITGLNKDITATKISESEAKTDYGIEFVENKEITAATTDADSNTVAVVTADVIELSDRRAFGTGNIVLKNQNGSNYRFYVDAEKTDFGTLTYTADDPRWTFSKGTLTLSEGTSDKWDYKVSGTKTDYNTLAISKGKTTAVATVKGLATDLVLKTDTEGKATEATYGLYAAVKEAEAGTLADAADPEPVVTIDIDGDTNLIKLTSGALVASPKNNAKVTLTVPKATTAKPIVTDFALDVTGVDEAEETDMAKANESAVAFTGQKNMWSVTKGTATYHHTDSAGWQLDSTGKTFTYTSTAKTTNLLKISGLNTDLTTLTGDTDAKGNKADVLINDSAFNTMTGITVNSDGINDDGEKETVFTLKNATKLGGKNVTLSVIDKENNYALYADESLAPQEYETKVTVDGKKGTVTLTDGISDGYVTPDETVNNKPNKNYGTTVTYSKEKPNKALFTISGLKTDGTTEGFTLASKVTVEEEDGTANVKIKNGSVLDYNPDNKTISIIDTSIFNKKAVSITGTGGYTFASIGTNDDADKLEAPIMIIKSGVINIVDRADENKYAISSDGKKINYNTKAVDTILATVKGLNKDIGQKDGDTKNLYINTTPKAATPTWSDAVGSVSFTDEDGKYTGTITLNDGALNNANVTFTKGKTAEEGQFSVELGSDVITENGSIEWKDVTEWTVSKGTATYKTYDKAYYSDDEKGGFKYNKEGKATTYATINGLKADKDTAIAKAFNESTESGGMSANLSITKDMLAEKNIVLKNSTVNGISGDFTLALASDDDTKAQKSTLTADTKFVSGKLTGTQSAGYLEASDTSITYLKGEKKGQLIATLTGINTKATDITAAADGTITLNTDQLAGKSVTLTTTDLAKLDYKLELATGTKAPDEPTVTAATTNGGWATKGANVVYTGLTTAGYTLAESNKAINYTKAAGTAAVEASADGKTKAKAEKPATLATIKNATLVSGDTESVTVKGVSDKQTTLSNGLFAVTYTGDNIAGSADSDTITLTKGASVKGGKGDDKITLGSGKYVILYGNGDGNDIITGFTSDDVIKLTGGKLTSIDASGTTAVVKVGTGSITLNSLANDTTVKVVDNKDATLGTVTITTSGNDLFADDNYSMDAAALSDIVEPFHASYTPYDFEAGLDLVKQNAFAPALTYTGNDKK